jgi:hypothetical protein
MGTPNKTVAQVEAETQNEIDEIMSEIQNLQQGLAEPAPKSAAPPTKTPPAKPQLKAVESVPGPQAAPAEEASMATEISMDDFRGSSDDASMEETLAGMKEEESNGTGLLDQAPVDAGEEQMSHHDENNESQAQEGSLTMTLTGNMTLKLKYEFEGQEVSVGFSENFLKVELSDGTQFRIPVGRTHLKAA